MKDNNSFPGSGGDLGRQAQGFRLLGLTCLVFFLVLSSNLTNLNAQITGSISGYVKDETRGVLPGATVTAVSQEQQQRRTVLTNETGFYSLLAMPRGTYEINAALDGFETQTHQGVVLTTGDDVRLDFILKVGGLETEVMVTSGAVMVNTKTQTVSELIDDRRIEDLPLNGRNVIALARTIPGATEIDAPQEMDNTRDGPNLVVHGGTKVHNLFTFNGANFTSFAQTTGYNPPPPDAVQEIRIQTHNFTAEYGHNSGSQISVISKAGSNEFHGSVWEFHRNDKLNARSFFQPRRPGQRQNQTGAAAGGPIVEDKLFVFGSFQKLWNRREAGSSQSLVPSSAQRTGDFTELSKTLKNPVDVLTGQPWTNAGGEPCVEGNVIKPDCISPVAQYVMDTYPGIPQSPTGTFVKLTPSPRDAYNWMTRVDFVVSQQNTLFGHFFSDHYDNLRPEGSFEGNIPRKSFTDIYNVGISDTHTFSSFFLNEATFSYMTSESFRGSETTPPSPRDMGIDVDADPLGRSMSLSVSGRFSISSPSAQEQKYDNWHFRDTMTRIMGRHTIKWGYEFVRADFHLAFSTNRDARFNGVRTGDATADFMLGAYDRTTVGFGTADSDPIIYKHMFFIQDEFKINPRFSITYGVRYEPYLPWKQEFEHYTAWDPNTQSVVDPGAPQGILFIGDPGVPDAMVYNDNNNFAPRVGFAWDVLGDGKTSVRGGYGLFYNQISANSVHAAEAPWRGTSQVFDGRIEDPFGSVGEPQPPSGATGEFGCVPIAGYPGIDCPLYPLPIRFVHTEKNMRTPYAQSFSLSIQRQLTPDFMLDLAYIGKIGIKLEGHRHWNPAQFINSPVTGDPPSSQNINDRVIESPGVISPLSRVLGGQYRSWYHGFQVKANKRLSEGFSFLGSYSLAKSLDSVVSANPGLTPGVANPFDLSNMKGRSQYDHRHAVSISWVWDPQFEFDNTFLNGLLGGWTLTGLHNLDSGAPLTIVMGTDIALDGTGGGSRQHALIVDGMTYDDITLDHSDRHSYTQEFFNTEAFVPTSQLPKGIYGNAGRNTISGPASAVSDFALLKHFDLPGPEGLRIQVRGEFFNAFNQVNFSNPNTRVASGSFGRITGASSGRVAQLAAKILW